MCELYELEPKEKLEVLVGLCHRLMTSYSAQDYLTSRQQTALELWYVAHKLLLCLNSLLQNKLRASHVHDLVFCLA